MNEQAWTIHELCDELARFERELQAAGLKPNSVHTYVDRSGRFLKWLAGEYRPVDRTHGSERPGLVPEVD